MTVLIVSKIKIIAIDGGKDACFCGLRFSLYFQVKAGTHILCIKDMAGLLKPNSSKILVDAIR